MKKFTAILLTAAVVLSMTGCGSSTEDSSVSEVSSVQVASADSPDETSAASESDDSVQSVKEVETVEESEQETEPAEETVIEETEDANITETIIYDANNIKVTAKSLTYSAYGDLELDVLIENNSASAVTVQVRNASVNGLMTDPLISADVAASMKTNDEISFFASELEELGITTITDIQFRLHIFDSNTWDTVADSDVISLTTDAVNYTQEYDDSGVAVYEENGIRIIAKNMDYESSYYGADLYLYIENNSGQDITIQARDVSVDGFMVTPVFSCDVANGKRALTTMTFSESDLTDNGITTIGQIQLYFHIFNLDSWNTIVDTPVLAITL